MAQDPRRDDTEDRLRRALHAQLDGAEPATPAAPAGGRGSRHAARIPFGLIAAAASIVVVAALASSRLPLTPGSHPASAANTAAVATPGAHASIVPAPVPPGLLSSPIAAPSLGPGTGEPAPQTAPARPGSTPGGAFVVPPSARVATPPPPATAPPAPRQTATASPAAPAPGTVVVTLAQAGATIGLAVGGHLEMQLGTGYQWSFAIAGSGVLAVVPAPLPTGVQGLWVAEHAGTASIRAVGNPLCLQATPPCGMPSRSFTVTVIVR